MNPDYLVWNALTNSVDTDQGPVVQSIVSLTSSFRGQSSVAQNIISLTSSLRGQLVKCFMTLQPNSLIFFVAKMREASAKASHIFSTKNIGVFQILTFGIVTKR